MDIEKIREFLVLASTCNYSTASDALFTTNSTLSKHIAQMEKELGYPLFNRTTRKVSLSKAGTFFFESAKKIVELYDQSLDAMKTLSEKDSNSFTISFLQMMQQYHVLSLINEFSIQYPQFEARMLETEGQNMNALLHSGACSFAFASRLDLFDETVGYEPYKTDELMLVVPRGHRLAQAGIVDIYDLRQETFVLHNSYYEKDEFLIECRRYGFEVNTLLSSSNESLVLDLVASSNAITVFSRARCLSIVNLNRFSIVEISPRITFTVYLLFLKNSINKPSQEAFIHFVKQKRDESLLQNE